MFWRLFWREPDLTQCVVMRRSRDSHVSVQFDPDERWHREKWWNDALAMFTATFCGCFVHHLPALISLVPMQLKELGPIGSFSTCLTCPKGGRMSVVPKVCVDLKGIFPPTPEFTWSAVTLNRPGWCGRPQWQWLIYQGEVLKCPQSSRLLRGRRSLWSWVMFIHSKVAGCIKMSHAQHECNQARLETAPLTLLLYLGFLYQQPLTSDPCPPPPSLSLSFKSFNPGHSVTPPFY